MYDDVHVVTADETAASNGLVAKGVIRIHKITLEGDGSNAIQVQLHDALTVTGTAQINLASSEQSVDSWARHVESDFSPPVRFHVGLSVNITGNGAVARIYYSR